MAGKALLDRGVQRRKDMLKFIQGYTKRNGISPTIQEIADGVGLASPNGTRNHLQRLQEEGKIHIVPNIARGITLK